MFARRVYTSARPANKRIATDTLVQDLSFGLPNRACSSTAIISSLRSYTHDRTVTLPLNCTRLRRPSHEMVRSSPALQLYRIIARSAHSKSPRLPCLIPVRVNLAATPALLLHPLAHSSFRRSLCTPSLLPLQSKNARMFRRAFMRLSLTSLVAILVHLRAACGRSLEHA